MKNEVKAYFIVPNDGADGIVGAFFKRWSGVYPFSVEERLVSGRRERRKAYKTGLPAVSELGKITKAFGVFAEPISSNADCTLVPYCPAEASRRMLGGSVRINTIGLPSLVVPRKES